MYSYVTLKPVGFSGCLLRHPSPRTSWRLFVPHLFSLALQRSNRQGCRTTTYSQKEIRTTCYKCLLLGLLPLSAEVAPTKCKMVARLRRFLCGWTCFSDSRRCNKPGANLQRRRDQLLLTRFLENVACNLWPNTYSLCGNNRASANNKGPFCISSEKLGQKLF